MVDETRVIELRIPSELGYEQMAMKLTGAIAQQMGFLPERVEDLKTAVSEACLNAIEHGNQLEPDAQVLVVLSIDVDCLSIDVQDEGRGGPPPDHLPEPDISRKVAGEEASRLMGIYVIRNLVDEAGFVKPTAGGGNLFRMVVHL